MRSADLLSFSVMERASWIALSTSGLRRLSVWLKVSRLSTVRPTLAGSMALASFVDLGDGTVELGRRRVERCDQACRIAQGVVDHLRGSRPSAWVKLSVFSTIRETRWPSMAFASSSALSTVRPTFAGSMALAIFEMSRHGAVELGRRLVEAGHESCRHCAGCSSMAWRFCSRDWVKPSTFSTMRVTRCGSTARTTVIDIGRQGLELLGQGPDLLGRLPDLGQEAVDALGVLAESLREALHVLDRPADGALVVGDDAPDPLQHVVGPPRDVARGLDQILEVGTVGEDRRHGLAGPRRQRRRARLAAREADIARRPSGPGIPGGPGYRRGSGSAVDLDDGDDPARILRQQADIGDLADPQAVEGDARALRQARDRAGEDDADGSGAPGPVSPPENQ